MAEERKLVSILFSDVTGSTELGEALDPEDARALMKRYYDHARQAITSHGGTLEKFIGDAVMAVFGLPQTHGNDAERALAAALALRAAVAADPRLAEQLLLRIGVNTGEVVATRDPMAGDFLVTGDAVNVAARLQQSAAPGEILAGERTKSASEAAFSFGAARAITVKGKGRPLTVYSLTGPRPARALRRPSLVGRRRELAQLRLLRDAALEERHPQLVSIVAPAGTGKTRLLEEFLAGLDPEEGWQVATARCLPYGQTLTYWPLRGLLDELLGAPFSHDAVAAAFTAAGHSEEDAERLAGLLLATLGVESGQQAERMSTFNAWRLLIEALARQAPRIVVFEDLHWASDSLLDLVEHITHPRTSAALLIIVLSRPELLDRRPSWGGGRRSFTAMALDALSEARTRELVAQLLPAVATEEARARIVERSGGNPFFAIELARNLAERGGAEVAPASASASAAPDTLPDTVHVAVLERLDLLSEPEREALQVAAVAGRTFRPLALRAALPERDPEVIAGALEGLLARDVLTLADGADEAYTFRHILFRDVAYGTLARAERVRLHLAVAGWLETFAADRLDEFVELLAYHYHEAALLASQSATARGDRGDRERAVRYLARAGELASRAGLIAPAVAHLRTAIGLADPDEHLRLYEALGDCAAHGDVAADGYARALELWRARGEPDPLTGARLLRKLVNMYWFWGDSAAPPSYEEMEAQHREALRLAERAGDEDELWRVRIAPLNPFMRSGGRAEREREREICAAAVAYFKQRGDWPSLYFALDTYAAYSQMLGEHEEALMASRRCLEWPDAPAWARGNVFHMIGAAYNGRGDYDACLASARDLLAQVRPGDPLELLSVGLNNVAIAAYISGRWSELDRLQPTLAQIWDEIQQSPGLSASSLSGRSFMTLVIALAREDHAASDAAMAMIERATPLSRPDSLALRSLAAAYQADDLARVDLEAFSHLQRRSATIPALLFAEHGLPVPDWIVQRLHDNGDGDNESAVFAIVSDALASSDDARLAGAIDIAEARHMVPFAARMRVVLAQRTGDKAELERARPVLKRLGDRQFLRKLEEVAAALGG